VRASFFVVMQTNHDPSRDDQENKRDQCFENWNLNTCLYPEQKEEEIKNQVRRVFYRLYIRTEEHTTYVVYRIDGREIGRTELLSGRTLKGGVITALIVSCRRLIASELRPPPAAANEDVVGPKIQALFDDMSNRIKNYDLPGSREKIDGDMKPILYTPSFLDWLRRWALSMFDWENERVFRYSEAALRRVHHDTPSSSTAVYRPMYVTVKNAITLAEVVCVHATYDVLVVNGDGEKPKAAKRVKKDHPKRKRSEGDGGGPKTAAARMLSLLEAIPRKKAE